MWKIVAVTETVWICRHYHFYRLPETYVKRLPLLLGVLLMSAILYSPGYGFAGTGIENLTRGQMLVHQALEAANKGQSNIAKQRYTEFNDLWRTTEESVKNRSVQAYKDIESKMGQVAYAFIQNKPEAIQNALLGLQQVNQKFIQGGYPVGIAAPLAQGNLHDFLNMLKATRLSADEKDKQAALNGIKKVRESWLSVEGIVVVQSGTVYNDAERDMVTVSAMLESGDLPRSSLLLGQMIDYLEPLANKTAYSIWDAAMIPLREGLEALLVIGALLAFSKRSSSKKSSRWVWYGSGAGILCSAMLAVIVKFLFSSKTFGTNNFLIAGWSGVFAAIMLLYVSYWLHSKSNLTEWNRYISSKTKDALASGRLASLAFLAFLAVFREGTETVLFIIGMINQISLQNLVMGLLVGCGSLVLVAYLMLFMGMRMPVRAFFLISSVIMLYLCIKFTGLGIHSLQLAGLFPSNVIAGLPGIDLLGFYPSWQSATPQLLILVTALAIISWQQLTNFRHKFNSLRRENGYETV